MILIVAEVRVASFILLSVYLITNEIVLLSIPFITWIQVLLLWSRVVQVVVNLSIRWI